MTIQFSSVDIRLSCSDLAKDDLDTLQVQVDKENLIEFLLDSLYYLYNYYMVCALLSHTHHVTCHVTPYDMILSCIPSCVISPKEKKKKSKYK